MYWKCILYFVIYSWTGLAGGILLYQLGICNLAGHTPASFRTLQLNTAAYMDLFTCYYLLTIQDRQEDLGAPGYVRPSTYLNDTGWSP